MTSSAETPAFPEGSAAVPSAAEDETRPGAAAAPAPGHPAHPRSAPVSFVRRGSRLQGRRQQAWEDHAASFVVEVPRGEADTSVDPGFVFDAAAVFGRTAPLVVEIGSGLGEAVVAAAAENPERDFLAVEVYKPGLANTLMRIAQRELTNVRVVQANAPEVLGSMLPPESVAELWVFFPDPWHKSKHHKRRLVKESFVPLAARVLAPGGLWRLATDWSSYAEQMREVLSGAPEFDNVHAGERTGADSPLTRARLSGADRERDGEPDSQGGWAPRFEGRTLTSFENKAHQAGRTIFDLTFRRR